MHKINLALDTIDLAFVSDHPVFGTRIAICKNELRNYFELGRAKEITIVLSKTPRPNSYFIKPVWGQSIKLKRSDGEEDILTLYIYTWIILKRLYKKGCWVSVEA